MKKLLLPFLLLLLSLSAFAKQVPALPKDRKIATICGSGYRSSIASSVLQARGYDLVENVTGGMETYSESAD